MKKYSAFEVRVFRAYFVLLYTFNLFCTKWDVVYLASFPRSGNHWARFLIEEASHIATGSVYRDGDYPHLPTRFPWNGYATDHGYKGDCRYPEIGEPVVVKTHYPILGRAHQTKFRTAICLVRNPIDAFYSFCVYRARGVAKERIPKEMLLDFIAKWRRFHEFWGRKKDVLWIRYEDMYQNPAECLQKMIQTIGYSVSLEDIQRAVDRYPPMGKPYKHISFYEKEEIELIKEKLGDLLLKYGYDF